MYHGDTPTWRFHTGLCKLSKFVRNISTNIWSLGKRLTGLKLGEVSYLGIFYSIKFFFSLFRWIVFDLFFYCMIVKTIYYYDDQKAISDICHIFTFRLQLSGDLTLFSHNLRSVPTYNGEFIRWSALTVLLRILLCIFGSWRDSPIFQLLLV